MATKLTPIDIFNSLTAKEKSKVLAMLTQAEPSPCSRLGHNFKPFKQISTGFLGTGPTVVVLVCSKCGDSLAR